MNDIPRKSDLPGTDALSVTDVDPRFDDAAAGTAPPRAAPSAAPRSAQAQFADLAAECSEWVRDKPLQALAVAAGLGFLLGRSGR